MTATNAQEFYGSAYVKAIAPAELDAAFKWLNKAIVFEAAGDDTKTNMAMNAALKAEAKAYATAVG